MHKTLIVACAVVGGLFAALAAPPPAQALPSVNLGIEKKADAVMHLARRGGHFRRHRFRHGHFGRHRFRHGHFRRHRFHHGRFRRHRFHGRRFHRSRRFY